MRCHSIRKKKWQKNIHMEDINLTLKIKLETIQSQRCIKIQVRSSSAMKNIVFVYITSKNIIAINVSIQKNK